MKSIKDQVNLNKDIELISMMDIRKHVGEIVDMVNFGKIFILTKAGKPIAALSPISEVDLIKNINPDGSLEYVRV